MAGYGSAGKRGYLHEDFRLFHLRDCRAQQLDYHYHEFDKIIFFLGGRVTYMVEGVTYFLKPWDILLVQHDQIHRAIIDPAEPYERIVIWLGDEWLKSRGGADAPLDTCFSLSSGRSFHLLRSDPERRLAYMQLIQDLEAALRSQEFGHALLADTLCQQLMIAVNRDILKDRTAQTQPGSYRMDAKIGEVLRYIAAHLTEELNVDDLAGHFYLSRYYLMHRFKAVTGYSVHQYIVKKRLMRAGDLIRSGMPIMKAAAESGFQEYSTFLRAFQNTFNVSPRAFQAQAAGQEEGTHADSGAD
ncbi:MAG: AraC family transcriptional regulator [Oscillibacter sp.]|jgi:AraC-like DNA-binding protein|nr:AraC family transcriptional regulator [Oscillibacter sp.]